ncbi:hypothetical protein JJB07_13055 [Tumebacillus sp. ITR2]|uniref:LPXTG cell wall anchor domain-containing protein n=1 Tax=Tumebacillus amylolyticus TaxID=2801339 RepID=A0ABS1JD76_9BACL|nr:hypothetical protein [Tumebacillus amylolyticus]MBL0387568.1 hypothetical protein [Tumebacillus amylolyticus]
MRKLFYVTLLCGFLTVTMTQPIYASIHSQVSTEVEKFAQTDGVVEAKKLLSLSPTDVGLSNKEEVEQLTLGPGLQIHSIDVEKLRKSTTHSLLSVSKAEQEWEFLLEKDGQAVTSIIIGKENGNYALQRVGGDSKNFLASWEKFDDYVASKVEPTLVVDKNVRYLVGTVKNQEVAIPDLSGNRNVKLNKVNPIQVSPASEIEKALKENLEADLINQKQGESQFGSGGNLPEQTPPTNNRFTWITAGFIVIGLLVISAFKWRRRKVS